MRLSNVRFLILLLLGSFVFASCSEPGYVEPRSIIDLSPTITPDLPRRMVGEKLIADFGFRGETLFEQVIGEDPLYYQDSYITLFNHTGPHVDAPVHVFRGEATASEYELERFFGPARVLDFSDHAPDQPISLDELRAQNLQAGDIVIVYTGYEPPTDPDAYPTFLVPTPEAVAYLSELPIKAYAVDLPSVDNLIRMFELMGDGIVDAAELLPIHHILLSKGIPAIEGLVHVDKLIHEENIVFVGFPLKMEQPGGDAGQMRAAALVY